MYSVKTETKETKKAKGIKMSVVKKMTHEDYKKALFEKATNHVQMHIIRSQLHSLTTAVCNKVGLCSYDDKRYILDDGVHTLAFGHHQIKSLQRCQKIKDSEK